MTTSKDLLLAILSLDAYNQGYGKGIDHGKDQIGLAKVRSLDNLVTEGEYQDWQTAGFYAIAYDTEYGTVISYRGTDDFSSLTSANDIVRGWITGTGIWQTDQVRMAAEFYQAVTGTTGGDPRTGDATLVGHSLGGGLAGFVASLYGEKANIFDNMPFELASDSAQDSANSDTLFGVLVRQYAQDTFYNGGEP